MSTQTRVRLPALFRRRKPSWPNPEESCGDLLEVNGSICWWDAKGPARHTFEEIFPKLKVHLDAVCKSLPSSDRVNVLIFMRGTSPTLPQTATPTIVVVGGRPDSRKDVWKAIKSSKLLEQHPGLRSGHMPQEPGWTRFEQLAMDEGSTPSMTHEIDCQEFDILYDPSETPIDPSCIQIFIKRNSVTKIRPATASLVRYSETLYCLTVAHAFTKEDESSTSGQVSDCDNELEFDSEYALEEYEFDDDDVDITSRYSQGPDSMSERSSLSEGQVDHSSEQSQSLSESSVQGTGSLIEPTIREVQNLENRPGFQRQNIVASYQRAPPTMPPAANLATIGKLTCRLVDLDVALVEIQSPQMFAAIAGLPITPSKPNHTSRNIAPEAKDTNVIALIPGARPLPGRLSGTTSLIRLPASTSFQKVYTVRLSGSLMDGDCGSLVINSETRALYGLIVAGCVQTGSAYVMAAPDGFQALENYMMLNSQNSAGNRSPPCMLICHAGGGIVDEKTKRIAFTNSRLKGHSEFEAFDSKLPILRSGLPLDSIRGVIDSSLSLGAGVAALSISGIESPRRTTMSLRATTVSSDTSSIFTNRSLGTDTFVSDTTDATSTFSDLDSSHKSAMVTQNVIYPEIYNRSALLEGTGTLIERLQKGFKDSNFQRTYIDGKAVNQEHGSAPVLKVGLCFLHGVDLPMVNRMELKSMILNELPDQRDPLWRINTAETLLSHFEVARDLGVAAKEQFDSREERMESRLQESESPLTMRSTSSAPALVRSRNAVTISSDKVKIVNELRNHTSEFDIESLLIEVNGPLFINFFSGWKHLIMALKGDQRNAVEKLFDGVRRLRYVCPILFRMSTRNRIIHSKDLRYGVDSSRRFHTLTTSSGIRETILLSDSCYKAIKDRAETDHGQERIRLQFLQVLVVLLSLLNDDDLCKVRSFIEDTYGFSADRPNLELLFLKVIPLVSLNSEIFLQAMLVSIEGYSPRKPINEEYHSHTWDIFFTRILPLGYILPDSLARLGRIQYSWIPNWPQYGIRSSFVFRHLQYAGKLRAFNEIPPFDDVSHREDDSYLTVTMSNDMRYKLHSIDHHRVINHMPGIYMVVDEEGRLFDLVIQESHLNHVSYEACMEINEIISIANSTLVDRKTFRFKSRRIAQLKRMDSVEQGELKPLSNYKILGRVTQHVAILDGTILAKTYRLDGRAITQRDALGILAADKKEMEVLLSYYEHCSKDRVRVDSVWRLLNRRLSDIRSLITSAEAVCEQIAAEDPLPDEPITAIVGSSFEALESTHVWNDYQCWLSSDRRLHIEAKRSTVTSVNWLSDKIIEVLLQNTSSKYVVSPLEEVNEAYRGDEIREGDFAILVGNYLAVAEPNYDDSSNDLIMTNYLTIVSVEEAHIARRSRRKSNEEWGSEICTFV